MKFCLDRRGSVTPFFAIVLASIVFMNFYFYDALRIIVLENETERRTDFTANSALALFDRTLEERYGLYCLREDERDEIDNRCFEMTDQSKSLADVAIEGLTMGQKGVSLNIMDYVVTDTSVALKGGLDDAEVLKTEIVDLMKYKSAANGAESVVKLLGEFVGASKKYDELKTDKELAELCELFKTKKYELGNKIEMANGFFESVFCGGAALLKSAVEEKSLPANLPYDAGAADMFKTALAIYAEGVFLYGDFCFEALEKTEEIIRFQEETAEKVSRIEKAAAENGKASEGVNQVKREVLQDNFLSIQTALSGNYRRLQQAENSYNKFIKSLRTGERIDILLFDSAMRDIETAYEKYERVTYSPGIRAIADTSYYKYGAPVDKEKEAGNFFGLCKNEIPEEIYDELPSKGDNAGSGLRGFETAKNLSDVIEQAGKAAVDGYLINDYVKTYFLTAADTKLINEHYLTAEREYIVCGKRSDKENIKIVYGEILALRTLMNVAHILADDIKYDEVELAAEAASVVTEGMGKEIYEAVIILGWATAEGANDMKRLEKGESVPFIKKREDWVLSIEGAFASEENEKEKNITGMKYGDYVNLLLNFVPKETKIRRIQDLIELNMYKKTNKYTKVGELYTGIEIKSSYNIKTLVMTDKNGKNRYEWEMQSEKKY